MPYAPRTIAFHCELRHPPLAPDPATIQRVHNEMFETGNPIYKGFHVTQEATVLSNPPHAQGMVSSAAFQADRMQFREEVSGLTVDEFSQRVRDVSGNVAKLFGVQFFTAQIVTIRTLVNPRTYRDSRDFFRDGMFGFGEELDGFRRPPQLYGLRLVFGPDAEEANAFTLRVESFATDSRSIFLENQGSFGPSPVASGLEPQGKNIQETYAFLIDRVLPFLRHFDARQEA